MSPTCSATACRPRRTVSSEVSSESRSRFRRNQSAVELAQRRAGLVHAHDRVRERLRLGRVGDEAVHAVLDELDAPRCPGSATTTARHAARRRLDHDEPVALAPRREEEAERAPQRARRTVSAVDEAGRLDGAVQPVLGDQRAAPRRGRGRRRRSRRAGRDPLARQRDRRHDRAARASRGCGVPRRRRAARRGRGSRRARPAPAYSPSSTVTSPRRPSSSSRRACRREKQNARWRMRAHSR